jgi:RNA polymerase sigma factor (sigma-70 family)
VPPRAPGGGHDDVDDCTAALIAHRISIALAQHASHPAGRAGRFFDRRRRWRKARHGPDIRRWCAGSRTSRRQAASRAHYHRTPRPAGRGQPRSAKRRGGLSNSDPCAECEAYLRSHIKILARYATSLATTYQLGPHAADDLLSEMSVVLFNRWASDLYLLPFDSADDIRTRFAFAVLRNKAREAARKIRKCPPTDDGLDELVDESEQPDSIAIRSQERAAILTAINTVLEDDEREIIFLHYYQKLNQATIATEIGMDPRTVSRRLASARRKLERALKSQFLDIRHVRGGVW